MIEGNKVTTKSSYRPHPPKYMECAPYLPPKPSGGCGVALERATKPTTSMEDKLMRHAGDDEPRREGG